MLTIGLILSTVADHYRVSVCDLQSERRTNAIILPRHYAMWLARLMTAKTNADIGTVFGGRDASAIVHAVRRVDHMSAVDATVTAELEILKAAVVEAARPDLHSAHVPASDVATLTVAVKAFLDAESVAVLALKTDRETKTQRDRNHAVAALRDAFNAFFSKDCDDDTLEQYAA